MTPPGPTVCELLKSVIVKSRENDHLKEAVEPSTRHCISVQTLFVACFSVGAEMLCLSVQAAAALPRCWREAARATRSSHVPRGGLACARGGS